MPIYLAMHFKSSYGRSLWPFIPGVQALPSEKVMLMVVEEKKYEFENSAFVVMDNVGGCDSIVEMHKIQFLSYP